MPHPASMSCYIGGVMSEETARAARMKKKSEKRRENKEKRIEKKFQSAACTNLELNF